MNRRHQNRHRVRGYDYSKAGAYFVTVVTRRRARLLGDLANGVVRLSGAGQIVVDCWNSIPNHFPNVELDQFVVMPNHLHGILWIQSPLPKNGQLIVRTTEFASSFLPELPEESLGVRDPIALLEIVCTNASSRPQPALAQPHRASLSAIVGAFKSATTKRIHELLSISPPNSARVTRSVWQDGFHEHILVNELSLARVRRYITTNVLKLSSIR